MTKPRIEALETTITLAKYLDSTQLRKEVAMGFIALRMSEEQGILDTFVQELVYDPKSCMLAYYIGLGMDRLMPKLDELANKAVGEEVEQFAANKKLIELFEETYKVMKGEFN